MIPLPTKLATCTEGDDLSERHLEKPRWATSSAMALARLGVLPTRLTAVDEAASMDVLCADKTGTLTQNGATELGTRSGRSDLRHRLTPPYQRSCIGATSSACH